MRMILQCPDTAILLCKLVAMPNTAAELLGLGRDSLATDRELQSNMQLGGLVGRDGSPTHFNATAPMVPLSGDTVDPFQSCTN